MQAHAQSAAAAARPPAPRPPLPQCACVSGWARYRRRAIQTHRLQLPQRGLQHSAVRLQAGGLPLQALLALGSSLQLGAQGICLGGIHGR